MSVQKSANNKEGDEDAESNSDEVVRRNGDVPMTTLDIMSQSVSIQKTGRATIPSDVREVLGVEKGGSVRFVIQGNGLVRVEKDD